MLTLLEHELDLVVARFTLDRHRELFEFQALAPGRCAWLQAASTRWPGPVKCRTGVWAVGRG